jgi:hypothetical protein
MRSVIKTTTILVLGLVFIVACNPSVDKQKTDLLMKYDKMVEMKDFGSAAFYLQEYLFLDSTNVEYMDSLARHFVVLDRVYAAEAMAKKVVEKQPFNEDMQTLLAQIDFQKGDLLTGMARFDKLFEKTKNYKFIFNKGQIYVQAQQVNKTMEIVEQLMSVPDADLKTIDVKLVSNPNSEQKVKIKAAALFLKAYAYLAGANPDTKKAYSVLQECLALQNNFEMAQALAQQAFPQSK